MAARFSFLPHAATSLAARAIPPDPGGSRLQLDLSVEIRANGTPALPRVVATGVLRGPGDIIGIEDAMISRVEPAQGLRGFEPNYMPMVEFRDADFPWRYTPELADGSDRRKPWLALIALKAAEFEALGKGSGPLSRIRVLSAKDSLPDLRQSWAAAHVQLNLGDQAGASAQVLTQREEDSFARLLCLRKLDPNTAYFLFLVPAYETGRRAGLGERALAADAPAGAHTASAWRAESDDPVLLPFYKQWRFITDALEDLEILMRRLRAIRADEADEPGAPQRVSAAEPGYYGDYHNPGATFTVECAMRQPGQPEPAFETDEVLVGRMVTTLDEVIAGEIGADDTEDPLVAFPPYGFRFRPDEHLVKADALSNKWFHRINLDLKFRLAAGLGAEVVRRNQELFAHHAWLQYDEIETANAALARAQLAERLVEIVSRRHFSRLAPEVVVALGEPLQPYARSATGAPVAATMRRMGVPTSYASRALRRVAAKRPMPSAAIDRAKAIPVPRLPGDQSPSVRLMAERPLPADRDIALRQMAGASRSFVSGLARLIPREAFVPQQRPVTGRVAVEPYDGRLLAAPIVDLSLALPRAKIRATIQGLTQAEFDAVKPIWRSPKLPFSLVSYLRDVDASAILSNATALPENTLAFFEESRTFLEAFMVGANHEMNEELRWREFPTDMRGTVFSRFWNKMDPAAVDFPEMHTWRGKLGSHFPSGDDGHPNLIVVIRGDIVRKLRDPVLEINFAAAPNVFLPYEGERHEPVFKDPLGPDIYYWGFNVSRAAVEAAGDRCFFVIYEPMGRFRFGLDVATAQRRRDRLDLSAIRHTFPVAAVRQSWRPAPRGAHLVAAPPTPVAPAPQTPDDLSWGHMRLSPSGYIDVSKNLAYTDTRGLPQLWDGSKTSASLARSFWQKPLAAFLPLARVT